MLVSYVKCAGHFGIQKTPVFRSLCVGLVALYRTYIRDKFGSCFLCEHLALVFSANMYGSTTHLPTTPLLLSYATNISSLVIATCSSHGLLNRRRQFRPQCRTPTNRFLSRSDSISLQASESNNAWFSWIEVSTSQANDSICIDLLTSKSPDSAPDHTFVLSKQIKVKPPSQPASPPWHDQCPRSCQLPFHRVFHIVTIFLHLHWLLLKCLQRNVPISTTLSPVLPRLHYHHQFLLRGQRRHFALDGIALRQVPSSPISPSTS
jgi:hypothetical protein